MLQKGHREKKNFPKTLGPCIHFVGQSSLIRAGLGKYPSSTLVSLGICWFHCQVWLLASSKSLRGSRSDNIELSPRIFYTGIGEELVSSTEVSCRMGCPEQQMQVEHFSKPFRCRCGQEGRWAHGFQRVLNRRVFLYTVGELQQFFSPYSRYLWWIRFRWSYRYLMCSAIFFNLFCQLQEIS